MIDSLLDQIAPHSCYGCGEVGSVLCAHCSNNIIDEPYLRCIFCLKLTSRGSVCGVCAERHALTGAWCVGERRSALHSTLDAYKFERVKAAATVFARLLHETVPVIGPDYVVATIPTASQHIRVRGYDHAELIAKEFAKLRGLPYQRLLDRETSVTQHFSTRRERFAHAKTAFKLRHKAQKVFLFDDIITTGATIQAAAELLRAGGAEEVYVGVIARQPLDGSSDL